MADLDLETRDAIRDLCEAVAILASGSVHMLGLTAAGEVMGKAKRLAERMDTLDNDEADPPHHDGCLIRTRPICSCGRNEALSMIEALSIIKEK